MNSTPSGFEEQMNDGPKLSAASMSAKYNSKRDIYYFLTVDVAAYLPCLECVTIYFLRDIISGKKKYVKCGKVSYIFVPQYDNLTLEKIGHFINDHMLVMDYFPETKEVKKFPKQFIVNILASVIGDEFRQWVRQRIEARNEKIATEKDINIDIDPVIFDIFNKSTNHTINKGIGANLLKAGAKRRRTHAEIKAEKEAAMKKESEIKEKLSQFDSLQQEVNLLKSQMKQAPQTPDESKRHVNDSKLKLKGSDYIIKGGTVCTQKSMTGQMHD